MKINLANIIGRPIFEVIYESFNTPIKAEQCKEITKKK